jgi:cytochrome c oxidase assembly factor CtaG
VSAQAPTLARLLGSWTLEPGVCAGLLLAAAVYLLAMRRSRRPWSWRRAALWLCGLLALALATMSGVDRYSELLLSVHMLQHLLLMLAAPVLLLAGRPVGLALAAARPAARRRLGVLLRSRAVRVASRPTVGFLALAVVVLATHLTGVFELALREPAVHALEHAAYLAAGLLFFAPILAADPLPRPPDAIARFGWLMGAMLVMAVPGALLTFATSVRYPHYLAPARALGRSALADQQLAGVIMWIGGGIAMFALALGLAMQAMLAEDRLQRRRERHAAGVDALASGAPR